MSPSVSATGRSDTNARDKQTIALRLPRMYVQVPWRALSAENYVPRIQARR